MWVKFSREGAGLQLLGKCHVIVKITGMNNRRILSYATIDHEFFVLKFCFGKYLILVADDLCCLFMYQQN